MENINVVNVKLTVKEFVNHYGTTIKMFKGQRNYMSKRNKDRAGFLGNILKAVQAKLTNNDLSENMNMFLKVIEKENDKKTGVLTNTKFFLSNKGEIFDGQHRANWLYEFISNQIKIYFNGELLNFEELKLKYPELVSAFLDFELDLDIADTDDFDVIAEIFAQINTGSKNVTKEDIVLSRMSKDEYSCVPMYKMLLSDDGSFFKYSPSFPLIYNSTPGKHFVRSAAYSMGIIEPKGNSNDLLLESFLSYYKTASKSDFLNSLAATGIAHSIIANNTELNNLCQKFGHHFTKAICKFIYVKFGTPINENGLNYRKISLEDAKKAEGFFEGKYELLSNIANTCKKALNDTYTDTGRAEELFNKFTMNL